MNRMMIVSQIILAEFLPFLRINKQAKLINLLQEINVTPLYIRWNEIIECQVKCLKSGANGIGIPDLIIAQNAKQNGCMVYALDKHFRLMNEILEVQLYTK